ncbi:MAG: RNA 3'-terminal phosphate cyclase [Candidatus Anammoximicrobium sp.]|nr:RNA 3'-terminal phosphate cyclase [Candidatus Anammoximicrobium sp.]
MIHIDGSQGEGGGQIVRSSLALSLVTGRPFTIHRVRARRRKPGLMRQHLTAVQAAMQVSSAHVQGAELGSTQLVFHPESVQSGEYAFRIGTAGSTTLVLQTVLPALMIADGVSSVTLEGGTHNPLAPPFEFLARTYLPLIARLGPQVPVTLHRPGFFPAGLGRISALIHPSPQLGRMELLERGARIGCKVRALVARLPRHIAQRECQTIARATGWDGSCFEVAEIADAPGPGNAVTIELQFEHVTEVFTGFGERGVRAETVAQRTLLQAEQYLATDVPVGEHLADQLLLPLGIGAHQGTGGGTFRTLPLSPHSLTHIQVLKEFLDVSIDVAFGPLGCQVRVEPAR